MSELKLVAPTVEVQRLWQSQYPGVEVLLSQKLPTTRKPIELTGAHKTLRKLAPKAQSKSNKGQA